MKPRRPVMAELRVRVPSRVIVRLDGQALALGGTRSSALRMALKLGMPLLDKRVVDFVGGVVGEDGGER